MTPLLRAAAVTVVAFFAPYATAADKRPMQVEDLFRLKRVAAPQISPDGKWVAYQVTTVNLEVNKTSTAIWVAAADGSSQPRQVTNSGKRDANPRWHPTQKKLLFESNRSGTSQLYVLDLEAGGEAKQVTNISTGAANGIWSPEGAHVAFVSAVYPEFSEKPFAESDRLNKEKDEEREKGPVKAKVFTRLFYRHWDEYVEDKRQHLFVLQVAYRKVDSPHSPYGLPNWQPHDATPGDRDAYPTSTTFSSGDDFSFSPNGTHLVFTAVPEKNEAWSTNYDICRVGIFNTSPKWEALTKDNPAADSGPKFSPDGKRLAWRAQKKAGYEADKWDILVVETKEDGTFSGNAENVTADAPLSVNEFTWQHNHILLFTSDLEGSTPVFQTDLRGRAVGLRQKGVNGSLTASNSAASEQTSFAMLNARMDRPGEVLIANRSVRDMKREPHDEFYNLSKANDALLSQLDLPRPESVAVPVEGDVKMHMWVLKPPGFDPGKKWPVVYLVHGGPQGAWEDGWSNRWNPEVWAARGYVVVMPNPRGSTGFGQKFVDEISGDWGGKCYRDLVAGLDYVTQLPYVDKDRIGAAGASFGGYMMNWFAVSDIAPRFKCLITHCSVWNFESMWGTTDELWFDEYEHGGLPWTVPGKYAEFSPHKKAANLGKHKTPMLVIHNDLDFRCPIGQGHELFSALQRQGVPSRFVNFPDEGHWVLKPQNSRYWHKEVFGWLEKHVPSGGR
jgi:dipeptidyl aminopeptidase/acylaminoacyl peptidase